MQHDQLHSVRPSLVSRIGLGCLVVAIATNVAPLCSAQWHYDSPPINYRKSKFDDRVAQLKSAIDEGLLELEWDPQRGWLPAMLECLSVPTDSQMLVFSKTSLQRRLISPRRPRALYFSDQVYVGWVQNGPILELSAVDPIQGAVFYTVDQRNPAAPVIKQDHAQCLTCHATRQTNDVPGYLVRSVFPDNQGEPRLDLGTRLSSTSTPYNQRFGGWYVTCRTGEFNHRGNLIVKDDQLTPLVSNAPENLEGVVDTRAYLEPGSDLVALLVLEHQTQMHNLITRASYDTRHALDYDLTMNRVLDRPQGHRPGSTKRRLHASAKALVRAMLFCDEPRLPEPVTGSSGFADAFADRGPFDKQHRSLRQFDLNTRLFRYPCSYLIYTDSFDALPPAVMQEVQRQLSAALADEPSEGFEHLSLGDRRAIREILQATKPGLLLP